MQNNIKDLLVQAFPKAEIIVQQQGSHFTVIVVCDELSTLTKIKQQQAVYKALDILFKNGAIHALNIKVLSTSDWQRQKLFNIQ